MKRILSLILWCVVALMSTTSFLIVSNYTKCPGFLQITGIVLGAIVIVGSIYEFIHPSK